MADNEMMKAIHQHKLAQQHEILIKARIMKLKKEEERANKRIRDAYRRNTMAQEMNKLKEDKIQTKANY